MPYPDEILASLLERYPLGDVQKIELQNTLLSPMVKANIEAGELDGKNLVVALPSCGQFFVSSPIAVEVAVQDQSRFETFKKLASDYPKMLAAWSFIKSKLLEINRLSLKETRLKHTLVQELFPNLMNFYQKNTHFFQTDPILREEAFHLLRSFSKYFNAMLEPMEVSARNYFTALLKQQNKEIVDILFTPKTAGDQLGRTMTIMYTITGETPVHKIVYHIKTHQDGSSIDRLGGGQIKPQVNPPDLKELLVYKVLEHTHIGPKAHFLFPPFSTEGGLYIATQSGAFSKTLGKEKTFLVFGKFKEDVEKQLSEGAQVRSEAQKGLTRIELFMRIFGLRDILDNSGNFGKTMMSNQEKWKIIDFRVTTEANYVNPEIYETFLTDDMSFYGLCLQQIKTQIIANHKEILVDVMKEFEEGIISVAHAPGRKMPLIPSIQKAFCEMICFVRTYSRELGINMKDVLGDFAALTPLDHAAILAHFDSLSLERRADFLKLGDLGRYVKAAIKNYLMFSSHLREDLSHSSVTNEARVG